MHATNKTRRWEEKPPLFTALAPLMDTGEGQIENCAKDLEVLLEREDDVDDLGMVPGANGRTPGTYSA
jgi:hypothetical protein